MSQRRACRKISRGCPLLAILIARPRQLPQLALDYLMLEVALEGELAQWSQGFPKLFKKKTVKLRLPTCPATWRRRSKLIAWA
jgi:hypothetical protein